MKPAPTMKYGGEKIKGKLIATLSTSQLADLIALGEEKLVEGAAKPKPPDWLASISINLDEVKQEFAKRELDAPAGESK